MTMELKRPRWGLSAGIFALALGGLIAPASAEEKTVTAVMHVGLRMLDPIVSTAHITRDHGYMVYDVLVAPNAEGRPTPQMADWTVSEDAKDYTFTLRDGLLFHDGAPVTAADAVASIKRWAARDGAGALALKVTESLEAKDDKTISWRFIEPFPLLPEVLGKESSVPAFIMPARVAATSPDEPITEYIGSGPFVFQESAYQPGISASYKKFDGYVPRDEPASGLSGGKKVEVDGVEWVTMPDQQTAINALSAGEVDLLENIQIDLMPILEATPGVVAEIRDTVGYQGIIRPNFLHPPFDDLRIRRAMMTAINQQDIMTTMVGNPEYLWTCSAVFNCNTPLGDETGGEILKAGGDPEKARAMLAEAGYDGTPIVVLHPTDVGPPSTVPVVVADQLRKAGFTVDLQTMDWQTLVARRANKAAPKDGGWNLFTTFAGGLETRSPVIHPVLPSTGETGWFGWADDPELEALRADYLRAPTFEDQKAVAAKVQARVMENVIYVPAGNYTQMQARSEKLTDMIASPVPLFWNMKLAD